MNTTFLSHWPLIDVPLGLWWIWSTAKTWKDSTKPPKSKEKGFDINSAEERGLGATVILGQLNAVITGVSIILAGIGAFIALGKTEIQDPANYHLLFATCWAVIAMAAALYTHGTLPHRTPDSNFVNVKSVAILCSAALFFSLAAGVRFVFAVAAILF
jgi:hypothetical protein